jgi:hypothetical protein
MPTLVAVVIGAAVAVVAMHWIFTRIENWFVDSATKPPITHSPARISGRMREDVVVIRPMGSVAPTDYYEV